MTRIVPNETGPAAGAEREVRLGPVARALEHAPLGVALLDLDGRCTWVNRELEAIGVLVAEGAEAEAGEGIPPPLSAAKLRQVIETERPTTAIETSGRGGDLIAPERVWLVTYFPVREERVLTGVGALVIDFTERVRDEERLTVLAEIGTMLDRRTNAQSVLADLARTMVPRFGDLCAVELLREDGSPTWRLQVPEVAADVPAGGGVTLDAHRRAALGGRAVRLASAAIVPLRASGNVFGLVTLATSGERRLEPDTVELLEEVVGRLGLALEDARVQQVTERVAETLQRHLLPDRMPELAGIATAARYLPAPAGLNVGGDWYALVPLPGGCVGFAVGDVVGRGATAAATMGQLRAALRAGALDGADPVVVLQRLERFASTLPAALGTTACYAVLDQEDGSLRYACAGHPPPLVVEPGSAPRYLMDGRSPPLGVASGRFAVAETTLGPEATILFYTDGLVERRDRPLDDGLDELCRLAESLAAEPLESMADRLVHHLASNEDDTAMLAVRRVPMQEPLRLSLPAVADRLAPARRAVEQWLEAAGADREERERIVLATGEALVNVIEHAYDGAPGRMELTLAHGAPGTVEIVVRDHGRWKPPRERADRGRGLWIISRVTTLVELASTPEGTLVRMRRRLHPVPPSGTPAAPAGPAAPDPQGSGKALEIEPRADCLLATCRLREIDIETSPALGTELRATGAPVGRRLVLDLSAVHYMDSAGAQWLVRLGKIWGTSLVVVAPRGSPIARFLAMLGLGLAVAGSVEEAASTRLRA